MKKKIKRKYEEEYMESDEYYYYIVGYTEGGAAYGITWEEAEEQGLIKREIIDYNDDENPF
ncbi:MAG: hypothetical protein RR904_07165 [Bacilli bacterium]